ncbi:MAG TPA: hypothetical protein EYP36_03520 [Calditrichaeota bacterium]|nr:hypothetical protein [Calditrichota bacterium]
MKITSNYLCNNHAAPTEHKSAQARILKYAAEIRLPDGQVGWTFVSRSEAEIGLTGGALAFVYAFYRIYHSIRVSIGLSYGDFVSELGIDLFVIAVFLVLQ